MKIILIALDLNPNIGSECINAHNWLMLLSEIYSVEVFVDGMHKRDTENYGYRDSVHFNYIDLNDVVTRSYREFGFYNIVYKNFIRKLRPDLIDMIRKEKIALIHYITPASIHSYNMLYNEIDLPYIIGPLGGGLKTPNGFYRIFGIREALKNYLRNLFYSLQKKNRYLTEYLSGATRIIIGTDYIREYLPAETDNKVKVIFDTFIDLKDFESRFSDEKKEFVQIVFSGHLTAIKGIYLLIEAIRVIKKKREDVVSNIRVVVLGEGPQRKKIEKFIRRHELSNIITLKGRVSRKKVIEHLGESDIFCLPTIRDHGGSAILEAMALSLPVITSDYGGPKYSVTQQCGIKIRAGNFRQYVDDLAEAIIKLVSDESLRKEMGSKARERVQGEFSMQALKKKIVDLYGNIQEVNC